MPWIIVAGTAAAIRSRSAVESLTSSAFKFARLAVPARHKRLSTSQPAFRTAAPDYAVACIRLDVSDAPCKSSTSARGPPGGASRLAKFHERCLGEDSPAPLGAAA